MKCIHLFLHLAQWCTTFFGRGPLIDFLISSGPNKCDDIAYMCQMNACQKMMFTLKYIA